MHMHKTCFRCGRFLAIEEFYRHPAMADGHLGKCKRCARTDVQDNRAKRREQYRAYERSRYTRDRLDRIKAIRRRERQKRLARVAVQNAVRSGRLVRRACEVCGDPKTDAHHHDYSRRLDVQWLCRIHHGRVHRMDPDRRIAV